MTWPFRLPIMRNADLPARRAAGMRISTSSSPAARTVFFGPRKNSSAGTVRLPARERSTNAASSATRGERVSPQGEALQTFPPMVARFRIWGEPIARAPWQRQAGRSVRPAISAIVVAAPIDDAFGGARARPAAR